MGLFKKKYTINNWDVKPYMPFDNDFRVKRKKNQIVPDELIQEPYNCSICLENAKNSHICVGFCGHTIHKKCFLQGTNASKEPHMLCPICRADYFVRKVYKCL